MTHRILFVLTAAFFVTMNVLLWRSEFRADGEPGSEVPVEVVARRLLTSPDNSHLEIFHSGKRTGFARWSANIGEDLATGRKMVSDQLIGEIRKLDSYTLDCDGEFQIGSFTNRYRFYLGAEFDTNMNWNYVSVRVIKRPQSWEVRADAETETLTVTHAVADGSPAFEQEFSFDELLEPGKLFQRMGLPLAGQALEGIAGRFAPGRRGGDVRDVASGIQWRAHNDHLKLHGARARVYRLGVKLTQDHEVVAVVSRVGEIMKVSLPYEINLVNQELVR